MNIRLIAADMDGTLLDSEKRLPDGLFPLVRALHERGVRFAPASGRQFYTLYEQFGEIADELMYISENGSMVCDGAKPSCAGKIAFSVNAGILGYVMYRDGQQFYGGDGIVKKGVENTIDSIARLGRDGMRATNDEIIRIMLGA